MLAFKSRWKTAVVVASGGLDSCVIATIASQTYQLAMLHAQYGQLTADRELRAFHDIADSLEASKRLVIPMAHFKAIGGSSLTDPELKVPLSGIEENVVPTTYVPFRNANLFSAAVSWAEVIGAEKVFVGINQMDSSGYPDCTSDFLNAFNRIVVCGTRPETKIEVVAPLLDMTKANIVETGVSLKAPLSRSWSCYKNSEVACGVCDSCRLRLDGFKQAGVEDPIEYETRLES